MALWNIQHEDESPKRGKRYQASLRRRDGTDPDWEDDPADRDCCKEEATSRRYTYRLTRQSSNLSGEPD